jgi:hypothetical protein
MALSAVAEGIVPWSVLCLAIGQDHLAARCCEEVHRAELLQIADA